MGIPGMPEHGELHREVKQTLLNPGLSMSNFIAPFIDQECTEALGACLCKGWLRFMDAAALDEVTSLLRTEPALLPVPEMAEVQAKQFDFSPAGAALYRAISAEWLGPDWEDRLQVSNVYYWIEHCYSEAEAGFDDEFACTSRDAVRTGQVMPIGPWCVYWWKRFPAGFRMELECGDERA